MLVMVSALISILITLTSHPVATLALILAQTIMLCLIMWMQVKSSWFSYILFLIFLGGLMVLFMYITSLASNEKFNPEIKTIKTTATYATLLMLTFHTMGYFFLMEVNSNNNLVGKNTLLLSNPNLVITSLIMTYLLLTLIIAVKITSKYEGPMKNYNKKN